VLDLASSTSATAAVADVGLTGLPDAASLFVTPVHHPAAPGVRLYEVILVVLTRPAVAAWCCRSLTKSLADLTAKWVGKAACEASIAGLPRLGTPGAGSHLPSCRRACMAHCLFRKTFPVLQVTFCGGATDPCSASVSLSLSATLSLCFTRVESV